MKTLVDHLSQYADYHRDPRNIHTHLVGVPMIMLAVVVLLSRPAWDVGGALPLSPAVCAAVLAAAFYTRLDTRLGIVMAMVLVLMLVVGAVLAAQPALVWLLAGVGLFVVGWVIQFVGHYYEGRKPAFVDDLMGLVIGPLFVAAEVAFLLGLRRELQAAIETRSGPVRLRPIPAVTNARG
jgi:uncharacterized membrane protein YGL010W